MKTRVFIWGVIFSIFCASSYAADTDVDAAVERGLNFLRSKQKDDGSFGDNVAVSALATMAFLAHGNVPGSGPDGDRVEKGLRHVISEQREDGSILGRGGRMYGHGICTLLLAEAAGMSKNEQVVTALRKACEVILRAQAVPKAPQFDGGWRYEPNSRDADISVTGWQLLSLRAAKDCGVHVPPEAIDKAVGFVKRCASMREGGFGYEPGGGPGLSRTGCGMVSLQMCGLYDAPEVTRSAKWIRQKPLSWTEHYFYYAVYYCTQAMYQCGGEDWTWWKDQLERVLLPQQNKDGSWPLSPNGSGEHQGGQVYSTAMAILALSVQYHYLPAYQR